MAQEFSPTEIFKRATAATLRAIAERDDLAIAFGPEAAGLTGTRVRLPNPARAREPVGESGVRGGGAGAGRGFGLPSHDRGRQQSGRDARRTVSPAGL